MADAPPSPVQAADEAQLVARARERDPAAFEQLIVAHAPPLQRTLRRVLGSNPDAEEVLQETFLKAWRAIDRFRGRRSGRGRLPLGCSRCTRTPRR